jgi:hypothetical protein
MVCTLGSSLFPDSNISLFARITLAAKLNVQNLGMSDLFMAEPRYYHFMVTLESESSAMRRMKSEYAAKVEMTKRQLKNTNRTVLLHVSRAGGRTIREIDPETVKRLAAEHDAAVLARTSFADEYSDDDYEYPATPESHEWPIRPNSSKRILSPAKLRELPSYSDVLRLPKDQPLIHGTGIVSTTHTLPLPRAIRRPVTPNNKRFKKIRRNFGN